MSKEGNIDDIFKDKLSEMEVLPSDAVWGRIESDLNNKPGRRKFWFFALTLLLITTMAIGGIIYDKPDNSSSYLAETQTESEKTTNTKKSNSSKESTSHTSIVDFHSINSQKASTNSLQEINIDNEVKNQGGNTEIIEDNTKENNIGISQISTSSNAAMTSERSTIATPKPLVSVGTRQMTQPTIVKVDSENSVDNKKPLTVELSSEFDSAFEPDFISTLSAGFPPKSALFNSSKRGNDTKKKNKQWMVGLYAGVNWNLKHLNYDSKEQRIIVDSVLSKESNTTTFSYGALATLKWKKHWRLTTGISYSKWCRKAVYPLDIPIDPNTIAGSPEGGYNSDLGGSTGGQNVNVPNDQISDYEAWSPIPSKLEFDLHVDECYEIISIPLRLGYEVYFSEFSLVPEIGIGYNRVIGNAINADASNDLDPIDFRKEEGYNKNMFSVSGSIGLERFLSPHFKIGVNGVYEYAISPLYRSSQFSTHPYTISGQVRLWYIFSK